MRNEAKRNGIIIGALLITIALMTIGYAALAAQLTITGTSEVTNASWNIEFESITKNTSLTSSTGVTETVNPPTASGTAATFGVELSKPGDKIVYDLVVVNNGTIDASFKEVTGLDELNATEPTAITYTVERLDTANGNVTTTNGDLVATGKNYFRVTIEWLGSSESMPTQKSKTGTISIAYEQKQ